MYYFVKLYDLICNPDKYLVSSGQSAADISTYKCYHYDTDRNPYSIRSFVPVNVL